MCSFFWFRISMEFNTWCSHTCMVRMVETLFNRKHLLLVTYKRFILELLASIKLIFHTVCHRAPCNNVFFKKKEKKFTFHCAIATLFPHSFPHSRQWIALQSPYSGEDNPSGTPKSRSFIQWGLYETSKIIPNGVDQSKVPPVWVALPSEGCSRRMEKRRSRRVIPGAQWESGGLV